MEPTYVWAHEHPSKSLLSNSTPRTAHHSLGSFWSPQLTAIQSTVLTAKTEMFNLEIGLCPCPLPKTFQKSPLLLQTRPRRWPWGMPSLQPPGLLPALPPYHLHRDSHVQLPLTAAPSLFRPQPSHHLIWDAFPDLLELGRSSLRSVSLSKQGWG